MTRIVLALCTLTALLAAAVITVSVAGPPAAAPHWLSSAGPSVVGLGVLLLVALRVWHDTAQRPTWMLFTLSLAAYVGAEVYAAARPTWTSASSWADAGWLLFIGLALAGLLTMTYAQLPTRRALLDAAITGLGAAAVFSALVLDVMLDVPEIDGLAAALSLVYPVIDVMLVGALSAQLALGRWGGPPSTMLMCSAGLLVIGDTAYAAPNLGSHISDGIATGIYVLSITLIGLAAWQRPRPAPAGADHDPLRISVWFAVSALVVLMVASRIWLSVVTVALAGMTLFGVVLRVVAAFRELEASNRARHLEARQDTLTGLANRRAVMEELDRLRQRPQAAPVALLLLDLNRFKQVNDVHGHQVGDNLLQQVADRLSEVAGTAALVGRLGGDEFVLVADGEHLDREAVDRLAGQIRGRVRDTYHLIGSDGTVSVGIDVSIGIAIRDDVDAEALLHHADLAMYQAKRAGGGHHLFEPAAGFPVAS